MMKKPRACFCEKMTFRSAAARQGRLIPPPKAEIAATISPDPNGKRLPQKAANRKATRLSPERSREGNCRQTRTSSSTWPERMASNVSLMRSGGQFHHCSRSSASTVSSEKRPLPGRARKCPRRSALPSSWAEPSRGTCTFFSLPALPSAGATPRHLFRHRRSAP